MTIVGRGGKNCRLIYLYDSDGSPIGMQYREPSMAQDVFYTYWFEKNLQGDIVAVYNEVGTKLISYKYDAWGNVSTTISHLGNWWEASLNPFRYRGYYYDTETGFYYLNSRYYNPEWGRFLNADTTDILALSGTLTDKNLFAYCDNNPVMRVDEDGEFWNIIAGAVIGAVINVGVSFVTAKILGEEYTWKDAIVDGVSGAIVGALASTGLGAVGQAIGGAIVGGASSVVSDLIHGEEINWIKAVNSAAAGGIAGYIGGSGLRANPGVKKADKTCLKVLDKVTSNSYATARGAKSAMTQAINRLNKVLVPATIKTTAMYSGASFLNSILMRSYNRVNS